MMPRLRLIGLLAVAGLPFAAAAWVPWATTAGLTLTLIALAVAVADVRRSETPRDVAVSRDVGEVLSVGADNPVRVRLRNRGGRPLVVELHDEAPAPCDTPDSNGIMRSRVRVVGRVAKRTDMITIVDGMTRAIRA